MDMLVSMGVAAILEAVKDRKVFLRNLPKLVKVYVALDRLRKLSPALDAAITKAEEK